MTPVLEVEVPMPDEVSENFLAIHEVKTGREREQGTRAENGRI